MSTGRHKFKLSELKRAIRGAKAAGLSVANIEITPTGSLVVHAGNPAENTEQPNEWDQALHGKAQAKVR